MQGKLTKRLPSSEFKAFPLSTFSEFSGFIEEFYVIIPRLRVRAKIDEFVKRRFLTLHETIKHYILLKNDLT